MGAIFANRMSHHELFKINVTLLCDKHFSTTKFNGVYMYLYF